MKYRIVFFLIIIGTLAFSQSQISNLKKITGCTTDTCLIRKCISNYKQIRYVDHDSATYYINFALALSKKTEEINLIAESFYCIADNYANNANYEISILYCDSALAIASDENLEELTSNIYNLLGIIYSDQGLYDKSIQYYNRAVEIGKRLNNKSILSKAYSNIGVSHYYKSEFQKAIDYYLKSLKLVEEIKDSANIAILMSNLGVFYQMQKQYDKALEILFSSLKYINSKSYKTLGDTYNNIAVTYTYVDSLDKSLFYYNEARVLSEKAGDFRGIATSYNNMADLYKRLKQYDKSIEYCKMAIEVCEKNNIGSDNAYYYRSLAVALFENKQYSEAEKYIELSNKLCKELGNKKLLADNYYLIADIYRNTRNFEKATEYLFLFKEINDTVQQQTYSESIAEMETKYLTEKKQQEIELLNKDNLIQAEKINKQKSLIITFIFVFIIIIVFSIFLYRLYSQKKKANILLQEKNFQISQQNEEITAQRDEIEAQRDEIEIQRDEAEQQRDLISHQKTEIESSIHYAKRIQHAVLPTKEIINQSIQDYFIFFRPRDIVSGDFYWASRKCDQLIVVAADCTGHGVPGAFMSMLGVSFLNEIVNRIADSGTLNAAEVLNQLRNKVIYSLHQTGKEGGSKDGMDLSIVIIDLIPTIDQGQKQFRIQYAGANNPAYVLETSNNQEITELKPDKMPIGVHENQDHPFVNQEINLNEGTQIFLFSDGLPDQFGGPKSASGGKKFKHSQLKEKILEWKSLPMEKQNENFEKTFEQWKGNLDQTDDVLLIGLKI